MKFIPEVSKEKFYAILNSNKEKLNQEYLHILYPLVEREIFSMEPPFSQINFPEQGGITAYFSPNMKKADLDLVREFHKAQNIDPLNCRAFKKADGTIEITVGSIEKSTKEVDFKGTKFRVVYGEFAPYLVEVNYYLEKAKNYASNDV